MPRDWPEPPVMSLLFEEAGGEGRHRYRADFRFTSSNSPFPASLLGGCEHAHWNRFDGITTWAVQLTMLV